MNKLSENQREQLSALVDDQVGPKELSAIEQADPKMHRYQLIGDALRGQISDASLVDVSRQVSVAIESEPGYSEVSAAVSKAYDADRGNQPDRFSFGAWLRPIGGMAIAASVTLVMVVTLNQQDSGVQLDGASGQIANIETQPVVSLPVSNVSQNLADRIRAEKFLEDTKAKEETDRLEAERHKNTVENAKDLKLP